MIQLQNVSKVYRTDRIETTALEDVNLTIEEGAFVSVMGPSGCGKTTLLNLMGLLDEPSQGTVHLDGTPINGGSEKHKARIRNRTAGFIFQNFHLISDLKVVDNVEIPLLYRSMSAKERRQAALQALDKVGLASRVHHYPTQLSGGQQQRVAIARAIVGRPKVLLADEPTGNLDSHNGEEVMGILETLNKEENTTIVMVTHDDRLGQRTQRTIRMFDGRQVH
ncbi:macrolide ABC transporter ATP-binding protein [Acidobacteria bacterium Mor1]|nr:macrolide ABC transporter ATP-binding protein [Acidobacteria bacterium Mor1]